MASRNRNWMRWWNRRSLIHATKPMSSLCIKKILSPSTKRAFEMNSVPTQLFIDGKPRSSSSGKKTTLINPATEESFAEVAAASAVDVDTAVRSAQTIWEREWRDLTPGKRTEILFQVARVMKERVEEF